MEYLKRHWKNLAGIALVVSLSLSGSDWLWGVLFTIWVIQGLVTGETFLIQTVKRKEAPSIYWVLILLWIGMAIYSFSAFFYPNYY